MPFSIRQFDFRETMPRIFVCLEQHRAIEQRFIGSDLILQRPSWVGVNLQRTAPLGFPALVKIYDQIQSAMQFLLFIVVEVHVWIQILPMPVLVRAASVVTRIVQQSGNARNLAHKIQKLR